MLNKQISNPLKDSREVSKLPTIIQLTNRAGIFVSINSPTIVITEDKARMILNKSENVSRRRAAWQLPFGFAITLLITLITANPKPFVSGSLGISEGFWNGLLSSLLVINIAWTIKALWDRPQKVTVDLVMEKLKGQS